MSLTRLRGMLPVKSNHAAQKRLESGRGAAGLGFSEFSACRNVREKNGVGGRVHSYARHCTLACTYIRLTFKYIIITMHTGAC